MNPIVLLLIFISIGASIGWITNKLALYFLFNPKNPKKVFLWEVQGIFPKRQSAIAERFSEVFVEEFFTSEMIQKALFNKDNLQKIYHSIEENLNSFLEQNLNANYPLLSLFVSKKRKQKIKDEIFDLIEFKITDFIHHFEDRLSEIIDIKSLIQEKINGLDTDQINQVMEKVLSKELRFIEISGAVLGGVIGVFQGLLAIYM